MIGYSFITLCHFNNAYANEDLFTLDLFDLLNVKVVSASLRDQSVGRAPASVLTINEQTIKDNNYRYLADLLADLPGINLSLYAASPDAGSSQIIVRGIRGNNKVVLMWNGQRLNHPDAQPLHITPYLYPLKNIAKVEIIYGANSALYGSDTVSMSINLLPKVPKGSEFLLGGYIGSDQQRSGYISLTHAFSENSNISWLFDSFDSNGVDLSFDDIYYSRYPDAAGVNASYSYFPKEMRHPFFHPSEKSWTSRLRWQHHHWDLQAYYQTFQTQTQYGWSPIIYEANHRAGAYIFDQYGIQIKHNYQLTDNTALLSIVDHTVNRLDPNSHWSRPNAVPFLEYNDSLPARGVGTRTYKLNYGEQVKLEERIIWSSEKNVWHWIAGIQWNDVALLPKTGNLDHPVPYSQSKQAERLEPLKFHHLNETNLAIYLQGQYDFRPVLSFTFGGRYDKQSRYGETFNPRFVANYSHPVDNWFVKAIYSTGTISPAAFFVYDTFLIPRSSQQVPNLNLAPEESQSIEINIGKFLSRMSAEISIFTIQIDNLIMQQQVKSVEQLTDELGSYQFTTLHSTNAGETHIHGASIDLNYQSEKRWRFNLNATYQTGETQDASNTGASYKLIHAPRIQAKAALYSKWFNDKLHLYLKTRYTGKAYYHPNNYRLPASDNDGNQFLMQDYWLFNVGGFFAINEATKITFNIENLFNERYQQPIAGQETSNWTRIAYTPGLPKQYTVGISWQF